MEPCIAKPKQQAGLTTVEMSVSVAVLVALFAGFGAAYVNLARLANVEMSRAALGLRTSSAADRVVSELAVARLDPPAGDGASVTFQMPVDPDGDGVLHDGNGIVSWGMSINGVDQSGATGTFAYIVDGQIDETILGTDVNGDGDQLDQFDVGHLERTLSDGTRSMLTGNWVLQPLGNHGGDVDGDLLPDPVFRIQENGDRKLVTMDLFTAWPVNAGEWGQWRYQYSVSLRNDWVSS